MGALLDALQWIGNFLGGSYDTTVSLLEHFWAWALEKYYVWWLTAKLYALQFAWAVASQILEDLGFGDFILGLWETFTPQIQSLLAFFHVPKVVNLLTTAVVSRMVIRSMPL